MKKRTFLNIAAACTLAVSASSCSILGNIQWDQNQLNSALGKMAVAASISDAEVEELCKQSTAQLDKENQIETGAYNTRLQKLVKSVNVKGLDLNFKVYKTKEVNAFASADGSVRVYTGLMDVMDDDELIAILGHEIGHVALGHVKAGMKTAYMASAARDVVGAAGAVGAVSQALLGDLAETLANAQFSQKQEYAADEFGYEFAIANGHTPYSMYNALNKLVQLSAGGQQNSYIAKMFSSHPDAVKRATKVKALADQYTASAQ